MTSAIGGDFELVPDLVSTSTSKVLPSSPLPLTGRTALHQALLHLRGRRPKAPIYLPVYLCESMIIAARATGADVHFFAVGSDLRMLSPEEIPSGAIVVLVRFFGLVDLATEIPRLRKAVPDCLVVADEVHAPWALNEATGADIAFTSWRKAYPVIGGAQIVPAIDWQPSGDPELFVVTRLAARAIKHMVRHGAPIQEASYLSLFGRAETFLQDPSALSAALPADRAPDLRHPSIAKFNARRRRNFLHLQAVISKFGLAPILPLHSGATPLFLPVLLPANFRNRVRRKLAQAQIYCPVHWPRPDGLPRDVGEQTLYERELSLIVDFRYDESDMDRLAETLGRALKDTG